MPRRPSVPCADCGELMWTSTSSLPPGQARCRPCRQARSNRAAPRQYECAACGVAFTSRSLVERKYCSTPCANRHKAQRVRSNDDPRVRRYQREQSAPGLSRRERDRLLDKWKQQNRTCNYCSAPASTIDHVVPLVRGGNNYEGNLTPCCRPCNGSKAGWTIIEWRTGRRLSQMTEPLRWKRPARRRPRKRLVVTALAFKTCPVCDAFHDRQVYCSPRCCSVANERRKTDRNRKPERTACPQGHPYAPENRRVRVRVRNGVPTTETECAVCTRERTRTRRAA